MAIAFRAIGAVATRNAVGGTVAVALPTGHVSGDLIVLTVLRDCVINETVPAGWTLRGRANVGTPSFANAPPFAAVYTIVDTGSLGASVSVTFSSASWPSGNPTAMVWTTAYSGCDPSAPVEVFLAATASGPAAAAQAHPAVTTATPGDWLVSVRLNSESGALTSSISGADTERLDSNFNGGAFNTLAVSYYDSNAALSTGLQTTRTTTTSGTATYGAVMFSLAIRPAAAAGATVAQAGTASGFGTAYPPAAVEVPGPWGTLCATPGGLPVYTWAVDWALSGFAAPGGIISSNGYLDTGDLTGWTASNCSLAFVRTPLGLRTLPTFRVVPNGSSASGGANNAHTPVGSIVPGQSYTAYGWVYSPAGWADLRAAIDWYTAADAFISTGGLASGTAVPAGVWTLLRQTLTAPATASRASVRLRHGGTPAATDVYYGWGVLLFDPSLPPDPRMVPDATAVVQSDLLADGALYAYGRDQFRQRNPAAIGTASFNLNNSARVYNPQNPASPLSGDLDASRPMKGQVVFGGAVYNLFTGQLDNYAVTATRSNRTASFTFQDASAAVVNAPLTTGVFTAVRTGDAMNAALDAAGWTGPRRIDPGATVIPYWWLENRKLSDAANDLVASEGPPSVAYVAPDGTFTFRDRHHRLISPASTTSQAAFSAGELGDCAPPPVTAGLSFAEPFTYDHGARDICNSVTFDAVRYALDAVLTAVWSSTSTYTVLAGQTLQVNASANSAFMNAAVPVSGTDFSVLGGATVTATISKTSGQSAVISLTSAGGTALVGGLQLRAQALVSGDSVRVGSTDTASVGQHGEQDYGQSAPWAGPADSQAVADTVVMLYAQRRPAVQMSVPSSDPTHYVQVLTRTVSDRVHIAFGELSLDDDFYVEHVEGTAVRMNPAGRPPVHSVVLGCELAGTSISNPFTFDVRGAGFDDGVFDANAASDSATLWVWDSQSVFDANLLGT